jgi:cell division septation protein DedD
MIARRPMPARHEFRVGSRELVVFGAAFLLIWALTFVFGVLVGRELTTAKPDARAAAPAGPGPSERLAAATRDKKVEPAVGSEERLTFYRTLTAPTLEVPPSVPPRIEERIVPHDPPPAGAARVPKSEPGDRAGTPRAPAASEAKGPAARTEPGPRAQPAPPEPAVTAKVPPAPRASAGPPPAKAAPAPRRATPPAAEPAGAREAPEAAVNGGAGAPRLWTVQVSSFRSRTLAEELRTRLTGKGFDAYLVSVTTEEGRVRHRVRVGGYTTRAEAERVAGELRTERNLNPFVTTRGR